MPGRIRASIASQALATLSAKIKPLGYASAKIKGTPTVKITLNNCLIAGS